MSKKERDLDLYIINKLLGQLVTALVRVKILEEERERFFLEGAQNISLEAIDAIKKGEKE